MRKMNIRESFQNKKFKFGGYATLMTAIVLAILIVVNLVVGQMNWKVDLTKNALYSLSQQTYDLLDALEEDITIYALYETGNENPAFAEILNNYSARSRRIRVEYRDPVLYPQFAAQYDKEGKGIATGSLIVVGTSGKFRVISAYDLVNYSFNQQTYQSTAESLAVEQRVTGAIQYITAEKNPVIYALKGHDETSLPYELTKQLEQENWELKDLNLLTETEFPEDGDVLLVVSPQRDISAEETQTIKDFLGNQGRAVFLLDLKQNEMPNLESVLNSYGVGLQKAIVVEGDAQRQFRNPLYLLPQQESHEILTPLRSKGLPVLIPVAQGIEALQVKKASIEIAPLLTTSQSSYGKVDFESTTIEKEADDLEGPFHVAVAITDKWYENNQEAKTKLIVVGNTQFLDSQVDAVSAGGNSDFILNSFNWLQERTESISIRPKSLQVSYLNINSFQALLFSGIAVILIPVIVMILGLVVWLRRRHR